MNSPSHDTHADHDPPAVAIVGASPAYVRGLRAALADRDWALETPADLDGWTARPAPRLLLVHLDPPADPDLVAAYTSQAVTVIALVADAIAEDHVALIRAGAAAVLDAQADPDHLALALDQINGGDAPVPLVTLHRLAAIARTSEDHPALAPEEIKWLSLLAQGRSIADLADSAHVSKRAVERALTAVYRRVGVDNRSQAIAWAARHHIID